MFRQNSGRRELTKWLSAFQMEMLAEGEPFFHADGIRLHDDQPILRSGDLRLVPQLRPFAFAFGTALMGEGLGARTELA